MTNAPIAIFGYNRADNLHRLIENLRGCDGFDQSPVHIFIDGPKGPGDEPAVLRTRDYVRSLSDPNIRYTLREENRGLRQSIYTGVSEVVAEHGRVIVLEDDLKLTQGALDYFNSALKKYAKDDRIWSVCGYMYEVIETAKQSDALILPFAHPWGWATWERSWSKFDIAAAPDAATMHSQDFIKSFDLNGSYPFATQLQQSALGNLNGWYIHWYYTIFKEKGLSVFPPRRVLDNNGLTGGTHGSSLNPFRFFRRKTQPMEGAVKLPDAVVPDIWFLDHLKRSTEMKLHKFVARAGMIKRRLKRMAS